VSLLRKRGEVVAMGSLTFGPKTVYLPIGAAALAASILLVGFDESVVTHASRRVEEITAHRFNRWGGWRFYFAPTPWYRRGNRIFYLRDGDADHGFKDVTVLAVDSQFQLQRRMDAQSLRFLGGTRWMLEGVQERSFRGDATQLTLKEELPLDLGVGPEG